MNKVLKIIFTLNSQINSSSSFDRRKMDTFSLCCYVKTFVANVNCESPEEKKDVFSGCNRMIVNLGPRISVWLVGILVVLGKLAVIAWRLIRRDDHPVQTCLLTNLAMSDFFMGAYLMIIAIRDQIWAGKTCQLLYVR